jgi:hypothetical protein
MSKLSKDRLNEIWRSGYCRQTVRFAATTEDTAEGKRQREGFMKVHMGGVGGQVCADCAYANRLKLIEAGVAYKLGPETYQRFVRGDNITTHPQFARVFAEMMDKAIEGGGVDEKMAEWMSTRSKRPNHSWEEDPT